MTQGPYRIDHDGASSLAWAVTLRVAQALRLGLQQRPRASLVLGGGTLADTVAARLGDAVLDWRRVTIVLAHDRWGEPGAPCSNAATVTAALDAGGARDAAFLPLRRGSGTAGDDARAAAFDVQQVPRPFDVVVVPIGADGRLGGLVPGSTGLDQLLSPRTPPTVAAVDLPQDDVPHLTLTLTAFADAATILLVGQGPGVHAAVARALGGSAGPIAALLERTAAPVEFHLCP